MSKGFMESGLIANDLLKLNFMTYGAGVFYRYGHYAEPDELDNFQFKLSMRISF
jgi:hypothetical protein